jgi:hypothetical protein
MADVLNPLTGKPAFQAGFQKHDPMAWGGQGHQIDGSGQDVFGTSGADRDVDRYRSLGSGYANTAAPMIDRSQADQARALQAGAIDRVGDAGNLYRLAATGQAPSAAETYGGKLIDDSIASQMAMAASAQGGPSAVSGAGRQAAFQGAVTQQSGARDLAAMRADEMDRARAGYLGSGSAYADQYAGMRNTDAGFAGAQADQEARQRALNAQQQQGYEQLGWNTRNAELGAEAQRSQVMGQNEANRRQEHAAENPSLWDKAKDVAGAVGGVVGGMFSDIRAKEDVQPVGGPNDVAAAMQSWSRSFGDPAQAHDAARIHDNAAEAQHIRESFGQGDHPSAGPSFLGGLAGGLRAFGGGAPSNAYAPRTTFSDEQTKYRPLAPVSGPSPSMLQLGGLEKGDVRSEIKANSAFGGKFMHGGAMMMSDEHSKYVSPNGGGGWAKNGGAISGSDAFRETMGNPMIRHNGPKGYGDEFITSDERSKYVVSDERAKEASRLKGQAEGLMAGMRSSLEAGPSARRLGGGTPENGFNTELTRGAEGAYQQWHDRTSPWDSGADYDLRGAFAEGMDRDGRGHLPDTFKKPNHETFSDESIYAPHGKPGHWQGKRFVPAKGDPMADANRSQEGSLYTYKPGFAEASGQAPGEPNVGPMAQTMASDPIAGTAVKTDPSTGLLVLDNDKLQKVQSAGIASLQRQVDALRRGGR